MEEYQIIRFKTGSLQLDVRISPNEDTVWLTKDQIALLFNRDRSVISRHIKNIFDEEELNENQVCAKNARTALDGKITRLIFIILML